MKAPASPCWGSVGMAYRPMTIRPREEIMIRCIIGNDIFEMEEPVYRVAMYIWKFPVNPHRCY